MNIPKLPNEYKGKERIAHHKEYDLKSRDWTEEEEKWLWDLYKQGYTIKQCAFSLDRGEVATGIKLKRLKKRYNEYNETHLNDKYSSNFKFLKLFNDDIIVLDVFCGVNSFYKNKGFNVVTNDKDKKIDAMYHMDADKFLDFIISKGDKFDIVDLDPFGASITYLEKALKIADKGLIMTLGELGHRRWKRLDFISKHYSNITKVEDITIDNMIEHIINHAEELGYTLEIVIKKDWGNIGRVYFKIIGKK